MKRREFLVGAAACAAVGPLAAVAAPRPVGELGTLDNFTFYQENITIDQLRSGFRTEDFYGEPWAAEDRDPQRESVSAEMWRDIYQQRWRELVGTEMRLLA